MMDPEEFSQSVGLQAAQALAYVAEPRDFGLFIQGPQVVPFYLYGLKGAVGE